MKLRKGKNNMSGQPRIFEDYISSLQSMKEPIVPKTRIDMRGAMQYALKKGVPVGDLTRKEKDMFIQYLEE